MSSPSTGRAAPILYDELSEWWPLLSPPSDYADDAAFYAGVLEARGGSGRLLEMGSGGGNNAVHLKRRFDLTLVDASAGMLDVSRALNPECRHVEGDMRSLRLGEEFDCVFVHDAVSYLTSIDEVKAMLRTAGLHLRPGGLFLAAPDYVRETFAAGTDCGGHDAGSRGLRYLSWTHDPDPSDSTFLSDYALMLREGDRVEVRHDRHVEGLFSTEQWRAALLDEGFQAEVVRYEHQHGPVGSVLFVGRKESQQGIGVSR